MLEVLGVVSVVLLVIAVVLLLVVMARARQGGVSASLKQLERAQERGERLLREEMERGRDEAARSAQLVREEVGGVVKDWGDTTVNNISQLGLQQKGQLDTFSEQLVKMTTSNEQRMVELRATVDTRLQKLQEDNAAKLELMRQTVDERLTATLEKRLGDSFKQVSERLEAVHQGLGEMKSLADGVGDLKRVLTNVKTRGTWGEVQLNMLLEQVLTADQYDSNVACKLGSGERVEYAIRLPGQESGDCAPVWLPIDAKFPVEDYQRMLEAQGLGDAAGVELALKGLETRVKQSAKEIQGKYLDPPRTTDFGIMFLPTEGLYAEVLRRPGLAESLQRDCRVIVAGPTTLAALLNSLQMGFRTLAIEKRSSEVWQLLGAVKTQFGQFGGLLEKVHKKLDQASTTIEDAARKSRTIERKLKNVAEIPAESVSEILSLVGGEGDEGPEGAEIYDTDVGTEDD
ncbi:MAG: recombinase RmuC [Actinobacteria bacterium RBG_16_64_13]|nr:MAG: recombinase RmuC [Actinobacteria bacterium RBG_16_64_13]